MTFRSLVSAAAAALLTASFAVPAAAQEAPGWSRGQQALNLNYDVCVSRMPQALRAEGYRIDSTSGNAAVGIKGYHTAVIICSPAPRGQLVQIVVASNGPGGGVERQRLQAQMGGTATSQGPTTTPRGNWTIALNGCSYIDPRFSLALNQDANGLITGMAYGRFDHADRAEVLTGADNSRLVGSTLKLTLHPMGWVSNLVFTGNWDGAKFVGPMHHYTTDDCTFAMFRS